MSVSLTIPQLFYDVIARVLPGFLFLFSLRVCLDGTRCDPGGVISTRPASSVGELLSGLGVVVLCYFAGWLLRGVSWPRQKPAEPVEFRCRLERVRLRSPESGFRILKLRAEARLLEASRVGMWLVSLLVLGTFVARRTDFVSGNPIGLGSWALRFLLPVLFGLALLRQEKIAWSHYFGSVETLHSLIGEGATPASAQRTAEQGTAAVGPSVRR